VTLVEQYTWLSLLPAFTAIALALYTKEVLPSLFAGIVVGGLISARYNIVNEFLIPAIGSVQYATILLVYLWCLGGLIGIWTRTGGAQAFAEVAARNIVRGRRSAKFFAWLMGIVFHQGGTISTVLAGTTVRSVSDKNKVSHEELSYVVDSTASPIAGVIPFNIWPIYVGGLAVGTIPLLADEESAINFFFIAIPFNFYGILAVLLTLFFALDLLPWTGKKMGKAIERVKNEGTLDHPDSTPLSSVELSVLKVPDSYKKSVVDFLVPMGLLIGIATGTYVYLGKVLIAEAFGVSVFSAALLALCRGLSIRNIIDGFVDGCKGMTIGAIVLGLAITLGQVSQELGTASFLIENISHLVIPVLLPLILIVTCMLIAFSTGTSFGTFAVVIPLALPLAWTISTDPNYIAICFASIIGGSMYGDQCSPISDTTVLSSIACGADVMDHVTTQLPLATAAAGVAIVLSTLAAWVILY